MRFAVDAQSFKNINRLYTFGAVSGRQFLCVMLAI